MSTFGVKKIDFESVMDDEFLQVLKFKEVDQFWNLKVVIMFSRHVFQQFTVSVWKFQHEYPWWTLWSMKASSEVFDGQKENIW